MKIIFSAFLFIFFSSTATAHSYHHNTDFLSGLLHPLLSVEHLLLLVTVGLLASFANKAVRWTLPISFVTAALVGLLLGNVSIGVTPLNSLLAASLVVLGVALTCRWDFGKFATPYVVGLFALLHGHSHGIETLHGKVALANIAGFILSCWVVMVVAIYLGMLAKQTKPGEMVVQGTGAIFTLVGLQMLIA